VDCHVSSSRGQEHSPWNKCQKININEDPNIHCLRTVLGGKSLVSCVFGSRFDVAGAAGACLKRYTDPSFFKMEWAKSELMKAQHKQLYKKANIEKVKSIFAAVNFLSFLTFVSIHWLWIVTRDHNTASFYELVDSLPTQPVVCMLLSF
jgi:hypothetical protein